MTGIPRKKICIILFADPYGELLHPAVNEPPGATPGFIKLQLAGPHEMECEREFPIGIMIGKHRFVYEEPLNELSLD